MARKTPFAGSLGASDLRPIKAGLARGNQRLASKYPGEAAGAQPVHTFYGGAHLFRADSVGKLGATALATLNEYAPNGAALAEALGLRTGSSPRGSANGLPLTVVDLVRARVVAKLRREPIEDFRIDFEDGYGTRPDAEEDGHATTAADEVAASHAAGTLPRRIGIRIKPLSRELHDRSLRTFDLFVTRLGHRSAGALPPDLVVTIPKVMSPEHVQAAARACHVLEQRLRIRAGTIRLEIMVETPQSILSADGSSTLRELVAGGDDRVIGAHFGVYDYTALCGITAAWQHLRHPACDVARAFMQVALAQSGVQLSDGGSHVMPVELHRAKRGFELNDEQRRENRDAIHRAWKIHYDDVRHSLMNGYYQGWDLHPAQLVTRYAAVFAFYLESRAAATARLRAFLDKAAQAALVGDVFDDAATGQALLIFFVRGFNCGALTLEEAADAGLSHSDLQGRTFLEILDARRQRDGSRTQVERKTTGGNHAR
ncbi:MAG: DUF6986 family protein [Acidobacteriota bacterium]